MFDCVLCAAGASSRMNPDGATARMGSSKPLLSLGSSTLVETAARAALDAGCRVLLVLGCRADEVAALFDAPAYAALRDSGRLELIRNRRWEEGMVGSIQAALPRLSGEAFFVSLADMPFVAAEDYGALAAARTACRAVSPSGAARTAFFASWSGREGHPVLLPSAWIPDLLALGRGERLRPFIEGRRIILVETSPGALRDIDTPDDYAAARKALRPG